MKFFVSYPTLIGNAQFYKTSMTYYSCLQSKIRKWNKIFMGKTVYLSETGYIQCRNLRFQKYVTDFFHFGIDR